MTIFSILWTPEDSVHRFQKLSPLNKTRTISPSRRRFPYGRIRVRVFTDKDYRGRFRRHTGPQRHLEIQTGPQFITSSTRLIQYNGTLSTCVPFFLSECEKSEEGGEERREGTYYLSVRKLSRGTSYEGTETITSLQRGSYKRNMFYYTALKQRL